MARKRSLESLLKILRQQISMVAERYSVEKREVFRFSIRSEQSTASDLDIPIPLKDTQSLLRFIAVEMICLILSALRLIW